MRNQRETFEATTQAMLSVLKENLHRSESTLSSYTRRWRFVQQFMAANNEQFLNSTVCDNYLLSAYGSKEFALLTDAEKKQVSSVLLLKHFILTGKIIPRKAPVSFYGEIGRNMVDYVSSRRSERLSDHTIYNIEQVLSRFLNFLNTENVTSINIITEVHIIRYLNSVSIKYNSLASISIHILRKFFRHLYQQKLIDIDLAAFFPRDNYKKQGKLPSTYSGEEIRKVLSTVDRSTNTGKRNYAILLLAAILGLRASDIANLEFKNIIWEHNTLRIIQYKTGKELELPLLPEVGNAIIEYLRYGRPASESSYVFLLATSPYSRTNQSVITQIAKKGFAQAKVNTTGRHHGAHALRHSLASLLLEDKVKLPVISEVLGHGSSDSTRYYLRVDLPSLRKCVLDVPSVNGLFYSQKGGYFYE